jgi:HEXXH motif-containing protein
MADAWRALDRDVPEQVAALSGLIRTVTPLRPDQGPVVCVARHAFGAVGVAPATDPDALAVMLLEAGRRIAFHALQDLCELIDPQWRPPATRPAPAPRTTPPPAAAPAAAAAARSAAEAALTLRDAYADLGLADLWRARQRLPGAAADVAGRRSRAHRDRAVANLDRLTQENALTADGACFVAGMRAAIAGSRGAR